MSRLTISIKLSVLVALLLSVLIIFMLVFFYFQMDSAAHDWFKSRAEGVAVVLASAAGPGIDAKDKEGLNNLLVRLEDVPDLTAVKVWGANTQAVSGWQETALPALPPNRPSSGGRFVVSEKDDLLTATVFFQTPRGTDASLMVEFSKKAVEADIASNSWFVLGIGVIILLLGLAASWVVGRTITRPIRVLTSVTTTIVQKSDLTIPIEVASDDEVGTLAKAFRDMVDRLRAILLGLNDLTDRIVQVTYEVSETTNLVASGFSNVQVKLDGSAASLHKMLTSLREIQDSVSVLNENAESSALFNQKMLEATSSVKTKVEGITIEMDETYQSIEGMVDSILDVSMSLESIKSSIENTSAAMSEMNVAIEHVKSNAFESAHSSEQVTENANLGVEALQKTLLGIERIRDSSTLATNVIDTLDSRIDDIASILAVINDVADQTNLLALNAGIIAAQAGRRGKGFAVVADEIKALATRTAASTREIGEVISNIQDESERASDAVRGGQVHVEQGRELGTRASQALSKIADSADHATAMVQSIARSTDEQANTSKQVNTAIQKLADAIQGISAYSTQQALASQRIRDGTSHMRDTAMVVLESTNEQGQVTEQISDALDQIIMLVSNLYHTQREHSTGAESTLKAVESIKDVMGDQLESVNRLTYSVDQLEKEADILREQVQKFKV